MNTQTTQTRKIGWVLLSPPDKAQPSTRIAALNMMSDLVRHGYASDILYKPDEGCEQPTLPLQELLERVRRESYEFVVFQKVHGASVRAFMDALRSEGIKTIYMVCDLVLPDLVERTDLTIAVSPYLRSLYPAGLQHKIIVVHDGIEYADLHRQTYSSSLGSRKEPLRAVLVTSAQLQNLGQLGSPPSWLQIHILGRYPSPPSLLADLKARTHTLIDADNWRLRWERLAFMSHPRIKTTNWSEAKAIGEMLKADIGIISVDTEASNPPDDLPPMWMRKSENRLTMKMSVGLPVIASPVPAYLDVIEHGVNGFIARKPSDWSRHLADLRDPDLRRQMGEKARLSVCQRYSRAQQARILSEALSAATLSHRFQQ